MSSFLKLIDQVEKRAVELDKFKRKELDAMALKYGIDTRYSIHDPIIGPSATAEDNLSKLEVIFTIIREELKR